MKPRADFSGDQDPIHGDFEARRSIWQQLGQSQVNPSMAQGCSPISSISIL